MAANEKTTPADADHTVPANTLQILPFLIRFFKGCGLILVVWLLGYFGFSALWGMILLFMHLGNKEYKKIKDQNKAFARQAAKNEKQAILARTEELPSWVFFPDVERAEWVNKIINKLWPYIGDYVKELLYKTVQPKVQESLPASLKSFKFEKIDLGDIPPRIGGVKVYNNVRRDEIFMDLELFYASDSDIKVSIKGLNAGIKDLQIHGTLRVVMKPLVNVMPLIGGINVFFLNNPTIDFDLTDLANALDFPGLSDTIRGIVQDQVAYFMVLPNRIPIQLAENIDIAKLKYPVPHGVLRIHAVAARELKRADFNLVGKGKSDPYCKFYVGAQSFKTKVISNTITPKWNQFFEAIIDQRFGQYLEVEVMDEDPGEDDELGTVSVDLQTVASRGHTDSWLPLEGVKTGMLHLRLMWLHLSADPEELEKAMKHNYQAEQTISSQEHLSSALLMVNLDSAENLPRNKKSLSEPSPYVVMNVGNDNVKSAVKANSLNPRWEENFKFLIHSPHLQDLIIQVRNLKKDKKQVKSPVMDTKTDKNLGTIVFPLKQLLTAKNLTINQPFILKESGPTSKLNIRMCLRILTTDAPPQSQAELDTLAASEDIDEDEGTSVDVPTTPTKDVPTTPTKESSPQPDSTVPDKTQPTSELIESKHAPEVSSPAPKQQSEGTELRKRVVSSSSESGDAGLGRIEVTIRYSMPRNRLVVVVHKCVNLIPCDNDNLADPYVRMYLLPEKSSSSKRKTQTVKNNLNPVFDETFDWAINATELTQRTLDILVKNSVGIFSNSKTHMGRVEIDMGAFDLGKPLTAWYDLQPPESADKSSAV